MMNDPKVLSETNNGVVIWQDTLSDNSRAFNVEYSGILIGCGSKVGANAVAKALDKHACWLEEVGMQ